jgi:hypothetical protein
VGIATGTAAVGAATGAFLEQGPTVGPASAVLATALAVGVVLSYRFPVHIQRSTKVFAASVILFLMASLLDPPLACISAAVAVFSGSWFMRSEGSLLLSDIATDASRLSLCVLAASAVAHWTPIAGDRPLMLLPAGLVLWLGDILTAPLIYYPITRDPPTVMIARLFRESGAAEAYQYLLGMLGALAEMQQPGALLLLAVPVVPLHIAFKATKETQDSTSMCSKPWPTR